MVIGIIPECRLAFFGTGGLRTFTTRPRLGPPWSKPLSPDLDDASAVARVRSNSSRKPCGYARTGTLSAKLFRSSVPLFQRLARNGRQVLYKASLPVLSESVACLQVPHCHLASRIPPTGGGCVSGRTWHAVQASVRLLAPSGRCDYPPTSMNVNSCGFSGDCLRNPTRLGQIQSSPTIVERIYFSFLTARHLRRAKRNATSAHRKSTPSICSSHELIAAGHIRGLKGVHIPSRGVSTPSFI
jgi:hypothetical protein